MRVGEAIAANRGDADLAAGRLIVRNGRFGKTRELALHPTTVAALRSYQRLRDRSAPATGGGRGQRSMAAMFALSWRSPAAGVRLFSRSS
jgi:integrase